MLNEDECSVSNTPKREKKTGCTSAAWSKWVFICRTINVFFEKLFTKLGFSITKRPRLTIILGVFICLGLTGGFARYRLVERSEDLYLPQNSEAYRDLEKAEKVFPMRYKNEEFIIKNENNPWILDDEIFKISLEIHNAIVNLPGFQEICIKQNKNWCMQISALEYFNYTESNIKNVSQVLNNIFRSRTHMSRTGRLAYTNFATHFGRFHFGAQSETIERAEAFRNMYFVKDPTNKDIYKKLTDFENRFIEYMESKTKELKNKGLILLYNCGRSIDISVSDSANKDITLVPVALILMVLFCAVTLSRFRNRILGHFTLGLGGVLTLFLGIASSFSFIMLVGEPYVAFAGVLPFLVLGVGIDNMFIIIDAVDRQPTTLLSSARIARALGQVGTSITMTTLTDLVAFFVSMVTDFPAIRYFCMYAAFSISFSYILVITVFIGMMALDVQRIEESRRDLVPCIREEEKEEAWEDARKTVSNKIMMHYAEYLTKTPVKLLTIMLSLVLLAGGIYGAINVDQSFDELVLGLDDSAYVKFFRYRNKAYPTGTPVSVIIDQAINYTDPGVQKKYSELSNIAKENRYTKHETYNWMKSMLEWSNKTGIQIVGQQFYPSLFLFLQQHPQFYIDLNIDPTTKLIKASRMIMLTKDSSHSIYRRDAMLTLRNDLKEKTFFPVFGIAYPYIYFEQFVVILYDTIRNLAICGCAILIITVPYLVDPKVTFFVFFGFVSLMFELFGVMYAWGVSLNAISMIVIVMGIGFSVDYSAHIAHAFVISNEKTSDRRIIYALRTMGTSVTMGGVSTFIGVIVTAFSSSELFIIFFKMVFGIVVLGLFHGLVSLPVFLSVCCLQNIRINLEEDGDDVEIIGEELIDGSKNTTT